MATTITDPVRRNGRYYTPGFIVDVMLRLALDPLLESRLPTQSPPLRILDPACGEGAFLVPIAERLKDWRAEHGMAGDGFASANLFGVDIDRDALTSLRVR